MVPCWKPTAKWQEKKEQRLTCSSTGDYTLQIMEKTKQCVVCTRMCARVRACASTCSHQEHSTGFTLHPKSAFWRQGGDGNDAGSGQIMVVVSKL